MSHHERLNVHMKSSKITRLMSIVKDNRLYPFEKKRDRCDQSLEYLTEKRKACKAPK